MTQIPIVVCGCVARQRDLQHKGVRSLIGSVLSVRNRSHLNAGPRLTVGFKGLQWRIEIYFEDSNYEGNS